MARIMIANRRTYVGRGSYVARPSALGNPFVIGRDGTREEVIEMYVQWLNRRLENPSSNQSAAIAGLVARLKAGRDVVLICWCSPARCHAEFIKRVLEERMRDAEDQI